MKYLLLILCFCVAQAGYKTEYISPIKETVLDTNDVVYDYGRELQGGIMIKSCQSATIQVRYGEAISETILDEASEEYEYNVISCDSNFFGNTGFRFVRIKNLPPCELKARHTYADHQLKGSFECSDTLLNRIWSTGYYTALLNIQNVCWDGIKRDRMVWAGDLFVHAETIYATIGAVEEIKAALEQLETQSNINGIAGYNIWWVLACHRYYEQTNDTAFINARIEKIYSITDTIASMIDSAGEEHILWGWKYLDWDMGANLIEKCHAGYQSLAAMLFECSFKLTNSVMYWEKLQSVKQHPVNSYGNPMAWSLCRLAGIKDSTEECDEANITPYASYFYLKALTKQDKQNEAIDFTKTYYGRMLELGATTFWERFRLSENIYSLPVDSISTSWQYLYNPNCGVNSLCHAWSSGVTAWLSQNVLGVSCQFHTNTNQISIKPNLGFLKYVSGQYTVNDKTFSIDNWMVNNKIHTHVAEL